MGEYIHLIHRGVLKISGRDKDHFLQGIITNDINILKEQDAIYSALLTPQGKFICDFFVINNGDHLLIDISLQRKEELTNTLMIYKLRSDVDIEDLSNQYNIYYLSRSDYHGHDTDIIIHDPRSEKMGFRLYTKHNFNNSLNPDFTKESDDFYETKRIENLIPEGDKDLTSRQSYPLEFGLDKINAISFTKGCYVGQEVVARMHLKHLTKREIKLIHLNEIDSNQFPKKDEIVLVNDKEIGKMCSSINDSGVIIKKR